MEFEQLRERLRRREITVPVLLDGDLVERHRQLDLELVVAARDDPKYNRAPQAPALVMQIEELEREIEVAQVPLLIRGISRGQFRELRQMYPPATEGEPWGPGFEEAIVQACIIDPVFDPEQAAWLVRELDEAEWRKIWQGILTACLGEQDRPKSIVASMITLRNALSDDTSIHEASPALSS